MPQLLPLIERDHTAWLRMNLEGGRRPISLTAAKPSCLDRYSADPSALAPHSVASRSPLVVR
jgi:hypothetical protein